MNVVIKVFIEGKEDEAKSVVFKGNSHIELYDTISNAVFFDHHAADSPMQELDDAIYTITTGNLPPNKKGASHE